MKKLLLFIAIAFIGMKAVAQMGIYNITSTNITINSVTLECDFAIAENTFNGRIATNASMSPFLIDYFQG